MCHNDIIKDCKKNLSELLNLVTTTEITVLEDEQSVNFVKGNINFFTKSFLLTLCSNLEICIKDVIFSILKDIEKRLSIAAIPKNLVEWKYNQKNKNNNVNEYFKISISKKEIDDLVSGNVYKTKSAFLILGIDLAYDAVEWETWKELIQTIVTRRNNVVHYNDNASDLSFGDIKTYIKSVEAYLDFINNACNR